MSHLARNLAIDGRLEDVGFLIHDRGQVLGAFDEVFRAKGVRVINTPIRPPNAKRWQS